MCLRSDHAVESMEFRFTTTNNAAVSISIDDIKNGDYELLDVREAEEAASTPVRLDGTINIPLGALLRKALDGELDKAASYVCICNQGARSSIACHNLRDFGYSAFSLDGGAAAITNPVSSWYNPEFVVLLQTTDPEKATLALSVATASQANGRKTALVCMADAPLLFRKADVEPSSSWARAATLDVGAPFKQGSVLLDKFSSAGGKVFACKSCVKFHKLSYEQLEDMVLPMQAPDLVRMSCVAQGTVTFS
eukprot:TRINITY_DN12904_c0_g1_i1.p1 TRINITY_DN12904_c0_g1~~TRINITY_DN12904_c0_g1_i1.p1  ORF type:complete len:251 (+),score=37.86 TRINITY_DN12904_c0_g1_i1:136-888(+)